MPNPNPIPSQAQTAEQFMLGARLLVQPVTAIDLASTNVYLPADDEATTAYWYDLHTAERRVS